MAGEKIVQQALKAVRELNPLGLFSRATEEASKIPQAKGTPQQMRAALLKQGVKPDELKWTGFDDWAKGRQSVTRDEVADFLRRNEVRVDESVLGYNPRVASLEARKQEIDSEIEAIVAREIAAGRVPAEHPQYKALSDEYYDIIDNRMSREEPTKFERYTFPGGENYRELLLKRPLATSPKAAEAYELIRRMNDGEFNSLDDAGRQAIFRQRDQLLREAKAEEGTPYRSSHFPDPNILAHLRLKDRTDPEGRRILHVEEIQSDWAQEGRKRGIKKEPLSEEETQEAIRLTGAALGNRATERDLARLSELDARAAPQINPVPAGPFIESTPKWTDLALKRALREAAEGGYDALAWTPGAQQAKRFDLSQQVSRVAYDPDKRRLWAYDPDGENVIDQSGVTPDKVSDYIGREAAERLLARPRAPYTNASGTPVPGSHFLEGQDLSVGGEGMIGYYDKIVPTQLQKLVRPMDPNAQLGTVSIPTPVRDARTTRLSDSELMAELSSDAPAPQARQLPSLNITPAMREKIKEGLPLFTMVPGAVGLGMAQPGQEEPREGFDKGGVVKKALKAVADLFNTPEMEKWRGKSVIPSSRVEDRYFHGTSKDKDFPQFNVGRHGVWLTKNPEEASEYALQNDSMGLRPGPGWSYEKTNTASRVIPVFARAENPYTGALPDFAMSPNYKRAQSEWFDQLRSQGHDAWLPESNPDLAVILRDPEQIKSAISNTGEFSGPRIDRAEGGEVRDGYAGGGKPIKSVIDQALAAIRKARPEQMRRAREQGFDTTKMYLHGTQTSPEVINPNFYVSRDPEIADIYARRGEHLLPEGQNPEGSAVMPVLVKKGSAVPGRPLTGYFSVLNPSDVRSVFAEFDPAKKDSGNIMSSIAAPIALGAGYMAEGEREERASGGRLLEDEYPTHYLPNVGRQVMADGGTPDDDIRRYEARMADIARQPEDIRSMTHAPSRPMRPIQIEGGLIGKRTLGEAPYDVAGPLSGIAQTAYSLKTLPFYFTPAAPFAAAADFGEAAIDTAKAAREGDYLGAGITGALGVAMPGYAYRKPIGDIVGRALNFVRGNPGAVGAGVAGAAMVAPEDAEASKLNAVRRGLEAVRGIRAYHGSPHDFDRFDLSKIGTGEGAQAYGHGLYFAENEGVAKSYKGVQGMASADPMPNVALKHLQAYGDTPEARDMTRLVFPKATDAEIEAAINVAKSPPPGHMYEVNIRANPEQFLDWDKPLAQQNESVREAFLKAQAGDDPLLRELLNTSPEGFMMQGIMPGAKGSAAYKTMASDDASPLRASQRLLDAGIPGIRYLDAGSRGAGEGSSNYVVFDDKLIDILRKYAKGGVAKELGSSPRETVKS